MVKKIIALSGMPASGKDVLTEALCRADDRFIAFKKHRGVSESDQPKSTYIDVDKATFEKKIRENEFVQYHQRYNRYYGISKSELLQDLKDNKVPIIHIGRIENYYMLKNGVDALTRETDMDIEMIHILIWARLDELKRRIEIREKTQDKINERIKAVKEEYKDIYELLKSKGLPYSLIIENNDLQATTKKIIDLSYGNEVQECSFIDLFDYLDAYWRKND